MNLQIGILAVSFIITVLLSLIVIPVLRKLKVGQQERDDGPASHLKKQGTPTMGGVVMIATMLIVIIAMCIYLFTSKNAENQQIAHNLLPLIFITVGFGVIGFIDDFKKLILRNTKGLKPAYKMLGLLFISVLYVLYLIKGINIGTDTYIPILKTYITMPIWIYIPFAICVILATTNAINLTDGVDGLSSSICAIILTCLTVIGMIFGNKEIVIFGSAAVGATLGFLLFNLHPAKVFMGDTGSLFLGGAIASMALYLKMPLLLIVIALIPVLETLSVIIQVAYFKKTGKRVFKMAPLHHHFELSGWKENKVVLVFNLITLVLCVIGLNII